jgi:hypothetical protein
MSITNGYANGHWKKALKTGLGLGIGVITANVVDPQRIVWTWLWWRHILIGAGVVFALNELAYLQNWLANTNGDS